MEILDDNGIIKDINIKMEFCGDGGVKNNFAGYGMVAIINNQILIKNNQRLQEVYNTYTSHRSEAYGILSTIITIEMIALVRSKYYPDNNKMEIKIWCNNMSVINTINKFKHNKP